MLPFLLDCQKRVGIAAWYRLRHARDRLPEFVTCVCDDRLKRAFVVHGNDPALDPASKQVSCQLLLLFIVEIPEFGLRVNVSKQLTQRLEFNEAVNSNGEHAAIFQKRCDTSIDDITSMILQSLMS